MREGCFSAGLEDADLVSGFRRRLGEGSVLLAFQPVLSVAGEGCEVLYHEVLGRQLPDGASPDMPPQSCAPAIGAMERLGCIGGFDMAVLHAAVDLLARHPDLRLGCNVSARTLARHDAWRSLAARLSGAGLASRLTLEITEAAPLPPQAMRAVAAMRGLGVRIAIDDVGGGYLSLAFVRDCAPDIIKIDRCVQAFDSRRDQAGADLLADMVRLCSRLSPCVVVEGIETEAALERAVRAGAAAFQGYFIEVPQVHPVWLDEVVRLRPRAGDLAGDGPLAPWHEPPMGRFA